MSDGIKKLDQIFYEDSVRCIYKDSCTYVKEKKCSTCKHFQQTKSYYKKK